MLRRTYGGGKLRTAHVYCTICTNPRLEELNDLIFLSLIGGNHGGPAWLIVWVKSSKLELSYALLWQVYAALIHFKQPHMRAVPNT